MNTWKAGDGSLLGQQRTGKGNGEQISCYSHGYLPLILIDTSSTSAAKSTAMGQSYPEVTASSYRTSSKHCRLSRLFHFTLLERKVEAYKLTKIAKPQLHTFDSHQEILEKILWPIMQAIRSGKAEVPDSR